MVTQVEASMALWCWQELRDRTLTERIRIMVERKMLPPDNDNEDALEDVRREMAADV